MLRDDDFHETEPRRGSSLLRNALIAVVAVGVAAGAYLLLRTPAAEPESAPEPRTAARAAAPRASADAPSAPSAPVERRPRAEAPEPEAEAVPEPSAAPEAPAPAVGPLLRVESDIPGASVFIDRNFIGRTPLETREVAAGSHRLNVSLEGYDGISDTVEVSEGGAPVMVRFREVRLDANVTAVHKHRLGSCEGRLHANAREMVYETSNKGDAFRVEYRDLEALEVDYLEKNLRVRLRGGRTYNFTEKSGNADALFVFQRDVQRVRDRIAKGDVPAARP